MPSYAPFSPFLPLTSSSSRSSSYSNSNPPTRLKLKVKVVSRYSSFSSSLWLSLPAVRSSLKQENRKCSPLLLLTVLFLWCFSGIHRALLLLILNQVSSFRASTTSKTPSAVLGFLGQTPKNTNHEDNHTVISCSNNPPISQPFSCLRVRNKSHESTLRQ